MCLVAHTGGALAHRLTPHLFDPEYRRIRRELVGKSAYTIAATAEIPDCDDYPLPVVPVGPDGVSGPYGHEKLAPVLSLATVRDEGDGIALARRNLDTQGRGHTAVIHTASHELAQRHGRELPASRILVNAGASQGCIGIGTRLTHSFTLGCGPFGGNSTTDNVSYMHLINVKRIAMGA